MRLDVWLWAARFFRTRSLARQAVDGGKVAVGGATAKPARPLRVGDTLDILRGEERFVVIVHALAAQRGPASAAQALYVESEESAAARAALREQRRLEGAGYSKPPKRPDKRARRLIRALGDIDAF